MASCYGVAAMAEEETRVARPAEPEEESAAALSEAARGVVRLSADPRLDAHLERMLSPGPARTSGDGLATELAAARADLEAARLELDAARARVRLLATLLVLCAVAILVLVGLALVR
jgi:hypothetical protein